MISHRSTSIYSFYRAMGRLSPLAISVCLLAAPAVRAESAAVKPLSIEHVLSQKAMAGLAISPDGQWYAYSVCDPAEEKESERAVMTGCSAWVQRRGEAQPRRISEGMGIELSWSPDGRYLAYQVYEGSEPKLWIWSREDGRSRKLTDQRLAWFGQIAQPVDWTPDGRHVLIKYALSGGKYFSESGTFEEKLPLWARQPSAVKAKIRATTAMLPPLDGSIGARASFVSQVGLALVDVATGKQRVLYPAQNISGARLSPDGTKVAYTVLTSDTDERYGSPSWNLGVLDVASGRTRILATDFFQYHGMNFSWSPDSKRIAYLSGPSEPEYIEERGVPGARLSIVSADGKSRRTFGGELRMRLSGYWAPYWTCDAKAVFVTAKDGLWKGDTSGKALARVAALKGYEPRDLVVGGGSGYRETQYACNASAASGPVHFVARDIMEAQDVWVRVQSDGRIETTPLGLSTAGTAFHPALLTDGGRRLVAAAQTVDKPMEVMEFDVQGRATALTSFNHRLKGYVFGKLRMIEFDGPAGKLRAAVLLPSDFREGQRYPAVLEMYPGFPMSVSASRTFGMGGLPVTNAQMLATRGYITMVFDSKTHQGTLSRDILAAVNAAADELVRRGWADADRLAMRGCSHAGYAVLATLMQTNRFKAGVAECGFGDLGNFWAYGWKHFIQYGIGKFMVPPWKDPARYVEHSPFYHADRINTPLMLVVGEQDKGFAEQSEQLHRALDDIGRESVLVSYEGEGHGLRRAENVRDFWERMLAFLDAKLKQE